MKSVVSYSNFLFQSLPWVWHQSTVHSGGFLDNNGLLFSVIEPLVFVVDKTCSLVFILSLLRMERQP